jgi:hypothetical protein
MTGLNSFQLSLPAKRPETDVEWSEFIGRLQDWGNRLPLDLPNIGDIRAGSPGGSNTNSGTFVDWPTGTPLTGTFTKRYGAETKLTVIAAGSAYKNTVGGGVTFGLQIANTDAGFAATDYTIGNYFFNTVSDHRTWVGQVEWLDTILPAGAWTFTLRALVNSGDNLLSDTNDRNQLFIVESFKNSRVA